MNQILSEDEQTAVDIFPSLLGNYRKTSEETLEYNCLAWSLGINWAWLDPEPHIAGYYWPPGIDRDWNNKTLRKLFGRHGYKEDASDSSLEDGYLKVAIYADNDGPSHFARQLPNGNWTSKLGKLIDVEHFNLECLEGMEQYGKVSFFLKKKVSLHEN
jgi:hypothetical protein